MSAPKRQPRRAKHIVHQSDYGERLEELAEQAVAARKEELQHPQRLAEPDDSGGEPESIQLAKQYDDLVEEARASDIVLELEKPPRTVVRKLEESHPPREGNRADRQFQVNIDTFLEDAVPLCIPDFGDGQPAAVWDEENELVVRMPAWVEFADTFSGREWDHLREDVLVLLYGVADLPKESLVSKLQELSRQGSKSPNDSPQAPRPRLTDGPTTTSSTPGPTSNASGDSAPTAETPTP